MWIFFSILINTFCSVKIFISFGLCSYVIDKKQTLIIEKKLEIGLNSSSVVCGCKNWTNCIKKGHNSPISNHPVIIDLHFFVESVVLLAFLAFVLVAGMWSWAS